MEDREKLLSTGGIGKGSMEVRFYLAEVGLRVFQEQNNLNKGTETGKSRPHFGK